MATNLVQYLIRQGTNSQRQSIVLASGELGFVTDPGQQRVFVGDGLTQGGIPVASKLYLIPSFTLGINILPYVQLNDIVYSTADQRLFALTAYPSISANNYTPIAKNF